MSDRTFDTSGLRTSDTLKWGGWEGRLGGVRIATAGSELRDSPYTDVQGFPLFSDDVLRPGSSPEVAHSGPLGA